MSTINALLKKRQKLEQRIAEAQRLEKRKVQILTLLEKHGLLSLSDEQILTALQRCAVLRTPPLDASNGGQA